MRQNEKNPTNLTNTTVKIAKSMVHCVNVFRYKDFKCVTTENVPLTVYNKIAYR